MGFKLKSTMDALKKYSPQYQHLNDTLAFVVHLSFLKQNCKLIGLSEEQYLDDLGSIPQAWNKSNEIYQFRYILKSNDQNNNKDEQKNDDNKHKQTILVKIISMDSNECLISAIREGSNDIYTLEITLSDHIDTEKASKSLNEYEIIYKDINSLLILLNEQITNKVIPKKKEKKVQKNENKKDKNPKPLIFPDPMNPNPNPLLIGGGRGRGGIPPFGGGFGGDMDPFGGNGGNLMGPDQINQQWRNQNQNDPNNPNGNRPPMVPDGARFDPFGPGPGIGRGRGRGNGRGDLGGFGGFGGGFGGFM